MGHFSLILNWDGYPRHRFQAPFPLHFHTLMLTTYLPCLYPNPQLSTLDTGPLTASISIANFTKKDKIIHSTNSISANLNFCNDFSKNITLITNLTKSDMKEWSLMIPPWFLTHFSKEAILMQFTMSKVSIGWWPAWTPTRGDTVITTTLSRFWGITDRIKCGHPGTYKFRIVNMSKRVSLYQRGMRPYVRTNLNPIWKQDGMNVRYGPSVLG